MKNNKNPLISVVMLNYDGLRYLKRTIPPILKLNYPNYEFIIVDNGSTDGSIDFIKKFKKIRLIQSTRLREKNFACNYAIKRARGEFILLIDNDLLITESSLLKSLISETKVHKDMGSLSLSFYNEGEEFFRDYGGFFSYLFIRNRKKVPLNEYQKFDGIQIGFPQGLGFLIKKEVWSKFGGYDEHLKFGGDDNDLGIRLWLGGYKNYLYSKTLQIHVGLAERKDNKKFSLKFKEMFYSQLYTIMKDFKLFNMIATIIGHSCFMFIKLTKQSISRLNLSPFFAFFQGYYFFLKNLPYNFKKRGEIQSKRVIKEDIFLKIKPPKFN